VNIITAHLAHHGFQGRRKDNHTALNPDGPAASSGQQEAFADSRLGYRLHVIELRLRAFLLHLIRGSATLGELHHVRGRKFRISKLSTININDKYICSLRDDRRAADFPC
jgi:hypothetical protein